MAPPDRIKRRLLSQAVRDNVDAMHGRPPAALRRGTQLRHTLVRAGFLVVVPSFVFLAWSLVWIGRTDRGGAQGPAVEASAPLATFPTPRPLDPSALPLAVKKLVIDPGHGGVDPGAQTASGLLEKAVTLDLAHRLRPLLERAGFEVALTRETDATVSLKQRAQFAKGERADLFVSIHVNSIPDPECRAVETYYVGPAGDTRAEQLAGAENRESGYSLADFRRLVEGIYTHVRRAESKKLAEAVHRELVAQLESANPGIRDNGVKSAPFLVLVATESPGILAEVSCLSSEDEARRLADPGYRQRIAWGLFQGIRGYAEQRNRLARAGSAHGGD
jgi:N-acetylmuramoyl-L-alanine amidase